MTLDQDGMPSHAVAAMERGVSPEPAWLVMARRQEAEARAEAKHERDLLDETESDEATEAHWRGVFAADPFPSVEYSAMVPGRAANKSGLNHAGGH